MGGVQGVPGGSGLFVFFSNLGCFQEHCSRLAGSGLLELLEWRVLGVGLVRFGFNCFPG